VSRSGYSDCCEGWELIRWRGAVASAIRGKRGQAFLRELLAAMDALPEKKLIANAFTADGAFCALGTVAHARGMDCERFDPDAPEEVAMLLDIPHALASEIMYENDEAHYHSMTPGVRFECVRNWVVSKLQEAP
jgi:hypothetical protein